MKSNHDVVKEITSSGLSFSLDMLYRMRMDCEYFLGYGNRCEKYLWAGNIKDHIEIMQGIYQAIPEEEKPEWINDKDIESFKNKMQPTA